MISMKEIAKVCNVSQAVVSKALADRPGVSPATRQRILEVARQFNYRPNALVRSPKWDIGLQKTGYITEAGQCLLMQASLAGRNVIMVLLDSAGKYSRIGDAERIRKWMLTTNPMPVGHGTAPAPVTADGLRITS